MESSLVSCEVVEDRWCPVIASGIAISGSPTYQPAEGSHPSIYSMMPASQVLTGHLKFLPSYRYVTKLTSDKSRHAFDIQLVVKFDKSEVI